jgi:hypothetical protein
MKTYPAKQLGLQLYAINKKYGTVNLYQMEGKTGLYWKDYDSEGEEIIKPLRNGVWIYDSIGNKSPYIKWRWEG